MRAWLLLNLLPAVASTLCFVDPSAPPVLGHMRAYMKSRPAKRLAAAGGERHRRSVYVSPLGALTIVGDVSSDQLRAMSRAYRHVARLFRMPAGETAVPITVIANATAPVIANNLQIVGQWDGTYVYVYLDVISSNDQLYAVTIHEILHALSFTGADYGYGSFSSRSDPDTLVYSGTGVSTCTGGATVRTDSYRVHWAEDDAFFGGDIQTPILSGDARVSKCTAAAVVESRGTWLSLACDTSSDCAGNATCYTVGDQLGGACLSVTQQSSEGIDRTTQQFPGFSPFVVGVIAFFRLLRQCALQKRARSALTTSSANKAAIRLSGSSVAVTFSTRDAFGNGRRHVWRGGIA